jgi:C4-dicarboxylate-specific signal transduction histidine kinase
MNKWFPRILNCLILTIGAATLQLPIRPESSKLSATMPGKWRLSRVKPSLMTGVRPMLVLHAKSAERRREEFNKLTPEEREAKRKELKERLEKRIAELRAKQTNGTLNAQETRELERREQILKRFDAAPLPAVQPACAHSQIVL